MSPNTFHTSLRTVTLHVICHTFWVAILHPLLCATTVTLHWQLSPFPNGTHTFFTALLLHVHFSHFLATSQFSNNSHTSPSRFHTSHTLIIPTPLQLPKHIPHDSHLSNNCYIFMTTFTPSWELQTIWQLLLMAISPLWQLWHLLSTHHQWLSHITNSYYICLYITYHILQEHQIWLITNKLPIFDIPIVSSVYSWMPYAYLYPQTCCNATRFCTIVHFPWPNLPVFFLPVDSFPPKYLKSQSHVTSSDIIISLE